MAGTRSVGTVAGPAVPGSMVSGSSGSPGPSRSPGAHGKPDKGLSRWDSLATPGRLWLGLLCSSLVILLLTATAALAVQGEQSSASQTSGVIEQRAVNIQELYHSLADADAAAATGILDSAALPVRFTQRYQADLNQADVSLAEASVDVSGDPVAFGQLELVDEQLSVYTGLIGTAQADNRLGYPVGGAYLRDASKLLEQTMLPEVFKVQQTEISARSASASASGGVPLWVLGAGLLAILGCVWTWRLLSRTTRRTINLGLAAATLICVGMVGWTVAASTGAASDMTTASADFQRVSQAQEARSDLAQISANEAASVVSRGEDITAAAPAGTAALAGQAALTDLENDPAVTGSTSVATINSDVATIQKDNGAGDYVDATTAMVGGQTAGGAQVTIDKLAATLATNEQQAQSDYQRDSSTAVGAYPGGPWPVLLLGLLAAAAAVSGINRRIAEYR